MLAKLFTYESIQAFLTSYVPTVDYVLQVYNINLPLEADHLGCLFHSSQEFDQISELISTYSEQIKEIILSGRRVRVFKLNTPIHAGKYTISKLEIFEPKPGADLATLRYGIEHISFYVKDWENFQKNTKPLLPIAKEGSVNTSFFVKTEILNTVEIEFRSDRLGEENIT